MAASIRQIVSALYFFINAISSPPFPNAELRQSFVRFIAYLYIKILFYIPETKYEHIICFLCVYF
jgi:hypothetical protein